MRASPSSRSSRASNRSPIWTRGSGTWATAPSARPGSDPDGISEWEAEQLLREAVVTAEDMVNHLLMEHSISVTQYQFDALVDMTYNLGTQWMDPEYRFCSYLISGVWQYSEAEVVNAIATWCHQGTTVLENLVSPPPAGCLPVPLRDVPEQPGEYLRLHTF